MVECGFPIFMSAAQALSPQRLAANRANAKLSTGPRSDAGKAKSSLNAVKTGLTGRTVLLPSEDAEAYETHLLQYLEEYRPFGVRETQLVQNLADTQWRLDRIPSLENGIYALGRVRYADLLGDQEALHVLDAHILMMEAKHFQNLHRQENRLRRYYQQDLRELKALQAERKKEQAKQEQAKQTEASKARSASVGFELSTPQNTPNHAQPSRRCEGEIHSSDLSEPLTLG
jgi:hypothetical protein